MPSLTDIPSEAQCRKLIRSTLKTCGHKILWPCNQDYGWCRICRKKIRPKAQTLFYGSKLSYRQLFGLVWCWQHRLSPGSVMAALGLSYTAIERWYERFRKALTASYSNGSNGKLYGVVEVDEAYFGKKRYGGQTIVIGAIEREPTPHTGIRRLKLKIIPDTEQDSLEKFIEDNIERGSLVVTDCHMGYNDIEWLGYGHELWNHSKGHFSGTNHIEQNWSAMKRYMMKLYGSIPTRNLSLILKEWDARHNNPELFLSPESFLGRVVPD